MTKALSTSFYEYEVTRKNFGHKTYHVTREEAMKIMEAIHEGVVKDITLTRDNKPIYILCDSIAGVEPMDYGEINEANGHIFEKMTLKQQFAFKKKHNI